MYQEITIIGNLGQKPVMRYTPQGKAVTNFSVAVNQRDDTMWVRVTTWGKLAENCNEYLDKGSQVFIKGRLDFDKKTGNPITYVSKKDGQTHANFELTAFTVQFLSTPEKKDEPQQSEGYTPPWRQ